MTIRAVVFDIGDVLEIAPDLGVDKRWETKLGLGDGDLVQRLEEVWAAGAIGTISEARRARRSAIDSVLPGSKPTR